ncbi:MAG: FMN-binding protein [Desulfobacteraceae bacterium]|jgi:electron transport complex protein RnfG
MKQILRITIGLTISCLLAALVMGSVFTVTDKAKKHNEHQNVQDTMLELLGYTNANPAPSDLKLYAIYRYIVEEGEEKYLGYLTPVERGNEEGYQLLLITLEGKFSESYDVRISPKKAIEAPDREKALKAVLKPPKRFTYADSTIIAKLGEKRLAYLLPGEFPGYKTFINVMLALDPTFKILGLEIMEHEEDPGLGAEIEEEYFKNQFKGKTFKKVKELEVIREPLPEEYMKYLEEETWEKGAFTEKEIESIRSKYQDQDIYALTGATISSEAVTNGVRGIIKRFAYRVGILDGVIAEQKIPVAF